MPELLWTSGLTFLITLVLTPIVRDVFHAYNVVDRPGLRKVHAHPIPRLGGIAVGTAYIFALIRSSGSIIDGDSLLWMLLPGAAMVLLTGVLDDFFSLPPVYKLAGQVVAAIFAFWSGVRLDTVFGFQVPLVVSLGITVVWLLLLMNALNLIDGLDGLCAGMGLIAAAALFTVGTLQSDEFLQQAMLPLAGALLGFLFHNFSRATMFLGDSGALLIGFVVGCGGILFAGHPGNADVPSGLLLVPLMVSFVPLLDVGLSIARRFLANRPIFKADRGHVHHRLLDSGVSKQRAVLALYTWALLGGLIAVALVLPSLQIWRPCLELAFFGIIILGIQRLGYSEFTMAQKLLFGGGLRKAIAAKQNVADLAGALRRSGSEEERWELLVAAARQAGWIELVWLRGETVLRSQVFSKEQEGTWSMDVSLTSPGSSPAERLHIRGPFPSGDPPFDLMEFARAVHKAFHLPVPALERSSLS